MFGRYVYVEFKGKNQRVFVLCTPDTPVEELKQRAIMMLESDELKKQDLKGRRLRIFYGL